MSNILCLLFNVYTVERIELFIQLNDNIYTCKYKFMPIDALSSIYINFTKEFLYDATGKSRNKVGYNS